VTRRRRALGALLALAAALAAPACRRGEGPQPIVFDREPCAHCRMLISEPRFAAQLQGADGTVASFDDPGCLFAYQAARPPAEGALWFHHVREERWLPGDRVAFTDVTPTPMGYGLGAVDADTPGALALGEARARVARREALRRGAP
jgi:copper chaperone NosL